MVEKRNGCSCLTLPDEPGQVFNDLPEVAGRRLFGTAQEFETRCLLQIYAEQLRFDTNHELVALMQDAVRLAREFQDCSAVVDEVAQSMRDMNAQLDELESA